MQCEAPTLALRLKGVNPDTGVGFKPYKFFPFGDLTGLVGKELEAKRDFFDRRFVRRFFKLKEKEGSDDVCILPDDGDLLKVRWFTRAGDEVLMLPCGKCPLCRRRYRRDWACRCIAEAQISNGGTFLTLTCSDDSLDETFPGGSLDHRPFQLFMKRLRKRESEMVKLADGDYNLRFFMCGEYGEKSRRPHYHVVIFGFTFPGWYFVGKSKSGQPLFSSALLDDLRCVDGREVFGPVSNFSPVSPADISYTVGYVDKKLARSSGEYASLGLSPEYVKMSRRPGIGEVFLRRYSGDIWKFKNDELLQDSVSLSGGRYFPPRYFFDKARITGLISNREYDIIKTERSGRSRQLSDKMLLENLRRAHAFAFRLNQRHNDVNVLREVQA